uniref:CSON006195 protein n=1 Tax=Culicoides sonorensis TaxID=179676 RepID=A0A336M7V9_CULSO
MMFMVGNLYAGHAIIAQQEQQQQQNPNQCKWEILNNFTGSTSENALKFKFHCIMFAPFVGPNSILQAIQQAKNNTNGNSFRERDFDKIHELTLECNTNRYYYNNNNNKNNGSFISSNTADLFHFYHNNNDDETDNRNGPEGIIENIGKHGITQLTEITIIGCQLKRLPDMMFQGYFRETLSKLTIQTGNLNDFKESPSNLELYSGAFKGLDRLRTLNLAYNHVWSVPSYVFCMLPVLKHLNLSHNSLTELTQLEFGQANNCTHTKLELLDVSYNKIVYIASHDLSVLKYLKILLLADNNIQEIYENGLSGLVELTTLDLMNNRLVALPVALFKNCCRNLVTLNLRNNSLSVLTPSIFDMLQKLEILDLGYNYFTSTWVNGFIFARLNKLTYMSLANNSLQRIDEFLFYDLKEMQTLELQNNEINVIHEKAFHNSRKLKYLNVAFNRMRTLNAIGFPEGSSLMQVSFASNSITNIDQNFFKPLKKLEDLNLSGNQLTEIPSGLGHLTQLKSLDLGKNNIHFIDGKKFLGLENLLGLRLVDNYLTNLSHISFQHLPSLQILNLASNHLRHIDKRTFQHNTQMHVIRLNNNRLEFLPSGIFKTLNMLVCLQELNLQNNHITQLLHTNAFMHHPHREHSLVLRGTKSSSKNFGSRSKNSIIINLKDNRLERIEQNALRITNESISDENDDDTETDIRRWNKEGEIKLYLQGNPLICDCHTQWLRDANENNNNYNHHANHDTIPQILDIQNVSCIIKKQLRQDLDRVMPVYVPKKHTYPFLCEYFTHCFTDCHCCDFAACDCKYTCPARCECFHDASWTLNIVDCGRAEYFDVPKHLPMDATDIYLDGNDMGILGEHLFIGKKNLEVLFLNTSQISGINNRTFVGAGNIKKLYLQNNFIRILTPTMFESLEKLRELYLDSNLIEILPDDMFLKHKHLRIINLSSNQLKSFDFIFTSLPSSTILALSLFRDNPYDCTICVDIDNIKTTTQIDLMRVIKLLKKICPMNKCGYTLPNNLLLPSSSHDLVMIQNDTIIIKREYLQLWAGILVAIIGTMFLLALACNFRTNVILYLYKKYKIRLFTDPTIRLDVHKSCDATMLFNNRDSEFIYRILSVQLENRGFELEYQNKILASGNEMQIIDTFVACAETSRRLVLILSANFLNIEYRNKTFQNALKSYLYRVSPKIRPYRLILVLSVPLDILLVDPTLDEMIRTCTVLFWGENQFWDKLFYSMPDPPHGQGGARRTSHKSPLSSKMLMQHQNTNGPKTTPVKCKTTTVDVIPQQISTKKKTDNNVASTVTDDNNKNNDEDNLSYSGLSQTQSYKFYNAQTYVNKTTGHIYTTIDTSNNTTNNIESSSSSAPNMNGGNNNISDTATMMITTKGNNNGVCIRDPTTTTISKTTEITTPTSMITNGKAYYV